jgi:ArsR family transcriptional regulator
MRTARRTFCLPVLQTKLGQGDARRLALAFKTLGDPARLRLLSLLAAQPGGEACVCHFSQPLGLSQPTVSHHLRVLRRAGLLTRERRGTWMYYRIVPERFAALRDALALPRNHRPTARSGGRLTPFARSASRGAGRSAAGR